MKAFISYANEEKHWGGYARKTLEALEMAPFLAQEDIAVSQEWKQRIVEELNDAAVFVAILSKAFVASKWCSQELGCIASRTAVLVIPLSLDDTITYGFLSHVQSERITTEKDLDRVLTGVLIREKSETVIPAAIKRLRNVCSWREAEFRMQPLVEHFARFTDTQTADLVDAAIQNSEIWNAALCRLEYLPLFLRINKSKITADRFNHLAERIGYEENTA